MMYLVAKFGTVVFGLSLFILTVFLCVWACPPELGVLGLLAAFPIAPSVGVVGGYLAYRGVCKQQTRDRHDKYQKLAQDVLDKHKELAQAILSGTHLPIMPKDIFKPLEGEIFLFMFAAQSTDDAKVVSKSRVVGKQTRSQKTYGGRVSVTETIRTPTTVHDVERCLDSGNLYVSNKGLHFCGRKDHVVIPYEDMTALLMPNTGDVEIIVHTKKKSFIFEEEDFQTRIAQVYIEVAYAASTKTT